MRNVSDKSCREDQNTHFMFSNFFFPENSAFYQNNVEKCCRVGQATDDNIIRRMRICCIRGGPGGEGIVDFVQGGTELETQVKAGSWAGCSHS